MKYELQKIVMKNCDIYNVLFESNVLGHILLSENSNILVQVGDLDIISLAESFGFEGNFLLADGEEYKTVNLSPALDFSPLYEFKIINLNDYFLSEAKTSE